MLFFKFDEILSICSPNIERKRNFGYIKCLNSGTILRKMTCKYNKPIGLLYLTLIKL